MTSGVDVLQNHREDLPFEISNLKFENLKSTQLAPTTLADDVNSPLTELLQEARSTETDIPDRPTAKAEIIPAWQTLAPWIAGVYVFGVAGMLLRMA